MFENKKIIFNPYLKKIVEFQTVIHRQPSNSPPSHHFNYTIFTKYIIKIESDNPKFASNTQLHPIHKKQLTQKISSPKLTSLRLPKIKEYSTQLLKQNHGTIKQLIIDTKNNLKATVEPLQPPKKYQKEYQIYKYHINQLSTSFVIKSKYHSHLQLCSQKSNQSSCEYEKNVTPGPGYYPLDLTSFHKTKQKVKGNLKSTKRFENILSININIDSHMILRNSHNLKNKKKISLNIIQYENSKIYRLQQIFQFSRTSILQSKIRYLIKSCSKNAKKFKRKFWSMLIAVYYSQRII